VTSKLESYKLSLAIKESLKVLSDQPVLTSLKRDLISITRNLLL
jgi:hypothetical protein